MITYQYAQSDDGTAKHIGEVTEAYRKAHVFSCFGCGKKLAAILGKQRERHFRHTPGCICNPETYWHNLGKQLFVELFESVKSQNKRLLVDFIQTKICVNPQCPIGRDHCVESEGEYKGLELYPHFNHYEVEKYDRDTGLTPDVLLTNDNGDKLYIEIFVSHKSSDDKIASNVPIVEIKISEEDDLNCLRPDLSGHDVKIDHAFTECFNISDSKVLAEKPVCLKFLDNARQHFIDFFHYHRRNEESLEIVYPCTKVCESPNCSYLKSGRCVKPSGFDRFDITTQFDASVKEENADAFSQDLIFSNGKKGKLRFQFGLKLDGNESFNENERVIRYAIDLDSNVFPWQEYPVIQEGSKVRFFKFSKKKTLDCNREIFNAIVVYKNGRCMPLKEHRIADIKGIILEQAQAISGYILIPLSRLEQELGFPSYKEQFQAAISVFKLKNLNVKNCFLCRYSGENMYNWDDESKPVFCKTFRFSCSSGQAVSCERYRIKYEAVQEYLYNEDMKRLFLECFETYRIK